MAPAWRLICLMLLVAGVASAADARRIVFTCPQAHSVMSQMLVLARELQRRGHDVEIWGNARFKGMAELKGISFVSQPAHLWPEGHVQKEVTDMVKASSMGADPWAWATVGKALGTLIGRLSHQDYDDFYTAFDKYLKDRPANLVITDFFSTAMMDWAITHDVPWILFYTVNLGHVAGWQDSWACPDPIHGDSLAAHQGSFLHRLRKLAATIQVIGTIVSTHAGPLDQKRIKHGVTPYAPPTVHINRHHTIVTNPTLFDVPRLMSPLTHMVGFMLEPFDVNLPRDQWNHQDVQWWEYLDGIVTNTHNGIIYLALGTEVYPDPAALKALLQGASTYAEAHDMTVLVVLRDEVQKHLPSDMLTSESLPPRVIVVPWVRQPAILAHPATKVFITHAGQASIAESIYAGVPMLAIPGFTDQPHNAYRLADHNLGLWLSPKLITPQAINNSLHQLLTESKFAQALSLWQQYTRHGPSPASRAADVVEEELFYHTSAMLVPVEHMSPPWMSTGLDVISFVLGVLVLILYGMYRGVRVVLRGLCGKKARPGANKSKEE